MNRVFIKVFFGFLSILVLHNSASALEAEFKNSLVKVDLIKVTDNSYNVDLYTQNKYIEPVKVIKKSDLNYYILLPETKNNTTKTSFNGNEIRSITTDLYPYAGQDVNNGYTKININTTKPLSLNVNVKNVASATKITKHQTDSALALKPEIQQNDVNKVQKKNLVSQNSKVDNQAKKEPQKQAIKTNSAKLPITQPKKSLNTLKEQIKPEKLQKKLEQPPSEPLVEDTQALNEVPFEIEENEIAEEEVNKENSTQETTTETNIEEDTSLENSALQFSNKFNEKILKIQQKIITKLSQNGISLIDIALVFIAGIATFIIVFIVLSRKTENTARLKSKADLIDKSEQTKQKIQVNSQDGTKNNGQYFIFDKNIKQTGFCDPATSTIKRNYELSSYEPELKNKYNRETTIEKQHTNKKENEYDIIQKILKEDSFIDISADEYKEAKQTLNEAPKQVATPPKQEVKKEVAQQVKQIAPPSVLSSVEIAPERGFMCVSYNDNINLMGYIFDDVFPLYNFKLPKLENYDIKFRLSERDEKSAYFIVKITNVKMLVKVTKSSMNMEVLL